MENRRAEAPAQRLVDPFRGEPVGPQRLVLDGELVALLPVNGEPEAARSTAGVTGERGQLAERLLRQPPVACRLLASDRLDRDVVRRGAAAEGEAAVAAARAAGDLAGVVQPNLRACLRERQRGGAAGDPAADDRDVGRAFDPALRNRRPRLVEPVARQRRREVAWRSGTKARLPTSRSFLNVL
jgi:hypothetical protein